MEKTNTPALTVCIVSSATSDSEELDDILSILEQEDVIVTQAPDWDANLKIRHFDMVNEKIAFASIVIVIASEDPDCVAATMLAITKNVPVLILNEGTNVLPDFYRGLTASRVNRGDGDTEKYPLYPKMRQFKVDPKHKPATVQRFVGAFLAPTSRYYTHGEFPEISLQHESVDRRNDVGVGC